MPATPEADLPLMLDDQTAAARFGLGQIEGADYREQLEAWVEEAEDTRGAIENSFEISLTGDEEDLSVLDQFLEGWLKQPPPVEELALIAVAWGAYVGELVQQNLGGSWVLRADAVHHSLRFPRWGMQLFPVHAVLRALTMGEKLEALYDRLVTALDA